MKPDYSWNLPTNEDGVWHCAECDFQCTKTKDLWEHYYKIHKEDVTNRRQRIKLAHVSDQVDAAWERNR